VFEYRWNMQMYHSVLVLRFNSVCQISDLSLVVSRAANIDGQLMVAQMAAVLIPAGLWVWHRGRVKE